MNKGLLAQLWFLVALQMLIGCAAQGELSAVDDAVAAVQHEEALAVSAGPTNQAVKPEAETVVLIVGLEQIRGRIGTLLGPSTSVTGRFIVSFQAEDRATITLTDQDCHAQADGKYPSTMNTSWSEVSALWTSTPSPQSTVTGQYELSLLPTYQVMLKLIPGWCD